MYVREYPIARTLQPILDEQIRQLKEDDIIELIPVNRTGNSPLIVVKQLTHNCNTKYRVGKRIMDDKHPLTPIWEQLLQFHATLGTFRLSISNQFQIIPESRKITAFTHNGQRLQRSTIRLKDSACNLSTSDEKNSREIYPSLQIRLMTFSSLPGKEATNHQDHVSTELQRLT